MRKKTAIKTTSNVTSDNSILSKIIEEISDYRDICQKHHDLLIEEIKTGSASPGKISESKIAAGKTYGAKDILMLIESIK